MFVHIEYVPRDSFSWFQLFGFLFLVFGTLLYNEIIVLPFWGYNQYTRAALAKKKHRELLNSERSTGAGDDIGY